MAEEYFDVVNERDEPIGRATRKEVHARGLWHRARSRRSGAALPCP